MPTEFIEILPILADDSLALSIVPIYFYLSSSFFLWILLPKTLNLRHCYCVCAENDDTFYSGVILSSKISFRCANRGFYVALGSSMGLALFVWVGRWSVEACFILFW